MQNHFTFDERECPVCAGAARWGRVLAADDDKFVKGLGKNPPPDASRPSDGRRTYARMKSEAEVAADDQSGPVRPHEDTRDLHQGNHTDKKRQSEQTSS